MAPATTIAVYCVKIFASHLSATMAIQCTATAEKENECIVANFTLRHPPPSPSPLIRFWIVDQLCDGVSA